MSRMSDLALSVYPDGLPGWKEPTTSRDAAKSITSHAKTLRERILVLLAGKNLTPDEAATLLGETVLSCRPRFSELKLQGMIEPTGERRKNESGLQAKVYRCSAAQG